MKQNDRPYEKNHTMGPFKCYVTQMGVGVGGVRFSGKKALRRCRCSMLLALRGGGLESNLHKNSVT